MHCGDTQVLCTTAAWHSPMEKVGGSSSVPFESHKGLGDAVQRPYSWCLSQLHAIPVFQRIKGEVLVSVPGSGGGWGPPALAPANLAAQILLRASQKAAPHVLLSRARCDTNQPHAPAQLHCCTTAMPRCSSSGSLGLCLHACHTPCSPVPSLAAGKQALPVFRSQHGGPSFASSILWHIGDRETELQPRWEWWVPALSVLLRACWGWENCSQVPFPPGAGAVFPAHCTSVHSPGCRGFLTERCFRIPCGALFIGAGLLFHSSVPFGRCNSSPIPLSVLFSFDRSFCYPHHLCLTAIPVSHAVSTTCSLTGRSLSKQETQMFSVLSSSFPLASKSRLRTTTGRARTARLSPSPHVGAANPAPPQPPPAHSHSRLSARPLQTFPSRCLLFWKNGFWKHAVSRQL